MTVKDSDLDALFANIFVSKQLYNSKAELCFFAEMKKNILQVFIKNVVDAKLKNISNRRVMLVVEGNAGERKEDIMIFVQLVFRMIGFACVDVVEISLQSFSDSTAATLIKSYDYALIFLTKGLAALCDKVPDIKDFFLRFCDLKGKDSIHPLLCEGGFGDTADKIVSTKTFLIRDITAMFSPFLSSYDSINSFVNGFFEICGPSGLGVIPDIIDLKSTNDPARLADKNLYNQCLEQLHVTQRQQVARYKLFIDLQSRLSDHPVKVFYSLEKYHEVTLPIVNEFLSPSSVAKSCLIMCSTETDTKLIGLSLSHFFATTSVANDPTKIIISIESSNLAGSDLSSDFLMILFKKLFLTPQHLSDAKNLHLIVIFHNYHKIGVYDNIILRNNLTSFKSTKLFFVCHKEFFQHRGYLSCFLPAASTRDLTQIMVKSLNIKCSLPDTLALYQKITGYNNINDNINNKTVAAEQKYTLTSKQRGFFLELSNFLVSLKPLLVQERLVKPNFHENPLSFISYAWEAANNPLQLEILQSFLLRLVDHFRCVGLPVWLDLEQMTGNIVSQMASNISVSENAFLICTPRYLERSQQTFTNVYLEYRDIVKKVESFGNNFRVFPILFRENLKAAENNNNNNNNNNNSNIQKEPYSSFLPSIPSDLQIGSVLANFCNFRNSEDGLSYIALMCNPDSGLIPKVFNASASSRWTSFKPKYQELFSKFFGDVNQRVISLHIIIDQNDHDIQSYDVNSRLDGHIDPHGLRNENDSLATRFDIKKYIFSFLEDERFTSLFTNQNMKTLLIFGRAGSGKSLLALSLFYDLTLSWSTSKWLPIYIPLRDSSIQVNFINNCLLSRYKLNHKDIGKLKSTNQRILFILDGYDELLTDANGMRPNLCIDYNDWPHAKYLIISRPEAFPKETSPNALIFSPDFLQKSSATLIDNVFLAPFTVEDIENYCNHFDAKLKSPATSVQVATTSFAELKNMESVLTLLGNPFLLNLALQSLPVLMSNREKFLNFDVLPSQIYESFLQTWFGQETTGREHVDIQQCFDFCQVVARKMFSIGIHHIPVRQVVSYDHQESKSKELKELQEYFFGFENSAYRDAAPMTRTSTAYSFIHTSILEYFVALEMIKQLKSIPAVDSTSASLSLSLSSIGLWGEKLLAADERGIMFLLADLAKLDGMKKQIWFYNNNSSKSASNNLNLKNPNYKDSLIFKLLQLLSQSKIIGIYNNNNNNNNNNNGIKLYTVFGSNAISVLNHCGYGFCEEEFSGVILPGADLSTCLASSSNFSNSIFCGKIVRGLASADANRHQISSRPVGAIFEGSSFISCNFDNCVFGQEVDFGEQPDIKGHKKEINCFCLNPDNTLFASADQDDCIKIWDVNTHELVLEFNHKHFRNENGGNYDLENDKIFSNGKWLVSIKSLIEIPAIQFSPIYNFLISAHRDGNLCIWNIAKKGSHPPQILEGHTGGVTCVALLKYKSNNSGEDLFFICSGSSDKSIKLWIDEADNRSDGVKKKLNMKMKGGSVSASGGDEKGKFILFKTYEKLHVADIVSILSVPSNVFTVSKSTSSSSSSSTSNANDNSPVYFLSASMDGIGYLCNALDGSVLKSYNFGEKFIELRIYMNGKLFSSSQKVDGKGIHMWDLNTCAKEKSFDCSSKNYYSPWRPFVVTSDARILILFDDVSKDVEVWDILLNIRLKTIKSSVVGFEYVDNADELPVHQASNAMILTSNDNKVLLGVKDGVIKIFDLNHKENGSSKQVKSSHDETETVLKFITEITLSPDGKKLAMTSIFDSDKIWIWSLLSGSLVKKIDIGITMLSNSLFTFSDDSKSLIVMEVESSYNKEIPEGFKNLAKNKLMIWNLESYSNETIDFINTNDAVQSRYLELLELRRKEITKFNEEKTKAKNLLKSKTDEFLVDYPEYFVHLSRYVYLDDSIFTNSNVLFSSDGKLSVFNGFGYLLLFTHQQKPLLQLTTSSRNDDVKSCQLITDISMACNIFGKELPLNFASSTFRNVIDLQPLQKKLLLQKQGVFQEYKGLLNNNGAFEGVGTLTLFKGDKSSVYRGNFKNGLREGEGSINYMDGSWYKGEWINNEITGKGEYKYSVENESSMIFSTLNAHHGCSFSITKDKYPFYQHYFHCKTCFPHREAGDEVDVCVFCVQNCHVGHEIIYGGYNVSYCACGSGLISVLNKSNHVCKCYFSEEEFLKLFPVVVEQNHGNPKPNEKMNQIESSSSSGSNSNSGNNINSDTNGKITPKYTPDMVTAPADQRLFCYDKSREEMIQLLTTEMIAGNMTIYNIHDVLRSDAVLKNNNNDGKGKGFFKSLFSSSGLKIKKAGRYQLEGYQIFDGGFVNDLKHGPGRLSFGGVLTIGTFFFDKLDGYGQQLITGDFFEGYFENGERNGYGRYLAKDGNIIEGQFKNNKMNGFGKFVNFDASEHYTGYFVDGKYHGDGVEYSNNMWLEGEFENNYLNGKGKLYKSNSTIIYDGDFKNGIPNGRGKEIFFRGTNKETVYEGEYANGKIVKGKTTMPTSPSFYFEGTFDSKQDRIFGTLRSESGSIYTGEFKNNEMDGKGRIIYSSDGSSPLAIKEYEGDFLAGNRHGFGVATLSDGSKQSGRWEFDKQIENLPNSTQAAASAPIIAQSLPPTLIATASVQRRNGKLQFTCVSDNLIGHVWEYEGEIVDDKACGNGKGILKLVDNSLENSKSFHDAVYVGEWMNNQRCGKGTYALSSNLSGNSKVGIVKIVGNWKNDKCNGFCEFDYDHNVHSAGRQHGKGTVIDDDLHGDDCEISYYDDGKKHTYCFKSYKGSMRKNKFEGRGVLAYYPSNSHHNIKYYEGEFSNNFFSGRGTAYYFPGHPHGVSKIVSEWKLSMMHGSDTEIFYGVPVKDTSGLKYLKGNTEKNLFQGYYEASYCDDFNVNVHYFKKYVGGVKNSLFDGQGLLTYFDGNKYEIINYQGTFEAGFFSGKGTAQYKKGKYSGGWKASQWDGIGCWTPNNGNPTWRMYQNGVDTGVKISIGKDGSFNMQM